eukprot:scaffold1736_cov127-Cylindrotheca_fusiformis.AAC.104
MSRHNLTPRRYVVVIISLLSFTGLFLSTSFQNVGRNAKQTTSRLSHQDIQHAETGGTHPTNLTADQENNRTLYPKPDPSKRKAKPFTGSPVSSQPEESSRTTKKEPSSSVPFDRQKATIVVALSGEMANNLMHIAHGIGLQLWAKDEFGIDCNIVLRHHVGPNNRAPRPKWKSARDNIQRCFPKLSDWEFAQGNTDLFKQQQDRQMEWLGKDKYNYITGLINSNNSSDIHRGLQYLNTTILQDPERPPRTATDVIELPYLYSETLDVFPLIDKYYTEIKEMFAFDDAACCDKIPLQDEYTFHYRNYISEMPSKRAYEMGFAELSPAKTATELFGKVPKGSRIGVTTRIPNQLARDQVDALNAIGGMDAYLVEEQEGVQDFCYLKNTQKQLVGNARSTFVFWAALLGETMELARLYHVDNWGLRQRHPNFYERFTYNWTHPALRERVRFELYQAEEME